MQPTIHRPVILCGFMACGKSTVGPLLARRLGVPFADTDELICRRARQSIPEIFAAVGEAGFREIEHAVAREMSALGPCVVSTGGGMLTFERNGLALGAAGPIVLITRDFETTWQHLSACPDRPLVRGKTRDEVLALYRAREPLYRRFASFAVSNDGTPEDCVQAIATRLASEETP